MKHLLAVLFILTSIFTIGQNRNSGISFKNKLNLQYGNKQTSPLSTKEVKTFKGLPFYEWNKAYAVIASVELTPNSTLFKMATTTNRAPLYQKYAIATFILNGKKHKLCIYQSQDSKFNLEYKDYLFLPFKDLTNGKETYEGGRYIDVFISNIVNNQIIIDFNKAFNPYCAYNKSYSCPMTPIENILSTAIEAGVKKGLLGK